MPFAALRLRMPAAPSAVSPALRASITIFAVLLVFALLPGRAFAQAVVVDAGDIACSPTADGFNAGLGTFGADAKCHQKYTSDLFEALQPAAILPLGDTQYGTATYGDFLESYDRRDADGKAMSWGRAKAITRPSVGNHEYAEKDPVTGAYTGASGYFDYFNGPGAPTGPAGDRDKGYYSFDVPVGTRSDGSEITWHLVALNSLCAQSEMAQAMGWLEGCAAGSPQERWLREDLAAAAARSDCTLAYWHHPRFSATASGNDRAMAPAWQALLDNYADVVLSGHHHNYQRFGQLDAGGSLAPGRGIRQFIVGTGGRDLGDAPTLSRPVEAFDKSAFGVLKLTLDDGWYEWEFVPDGHSGAFTDSGRGDCVQPPPTISAGPDGLTSSPSASFEFSSASGGRSFDCSLDAAAWQPCASPAVYGGLSDGEHGFRVRTTSPTGTSDPLAAERRFTVDATAPSIGAPPAGTFSGVVALDASADDSHGVRRVEWLLDGALIGSDEAAPWAQSWDTVKTPDGRHRLEVQAVDSVGNIGRSAPAEVLVNNAPPTLPTLSALPIGRRLGANVDVTSRRSLRALRRTGLTLEVSCSRRCRVASRLALPAATARRVRLRGAVATAANGRLRRSHHLSLRLNRHARRRTSSLKAIKLILKVVATDSNRQSRTSSKTIVFR